MKMFKQLLVLLMASMPLWAVHGQDDPRLERLYGTFMSPCCWQQNLTVHESPTADSLRAQIRGMVAEGKSDDEIKAAMIAQYSPRILALPEGASRKWLFVTPWVVAGAAVFALVFALARMRRRAIAAAEHANPAPAQGAHWPDFFDD